MLVSGQGGRPLATYRTAQVCRNGHPTTESLEESPERAAAYCSDCGEPTICECPDCDAGIRGKYKVEGGYPDFSGYAPPGYCYQCGSPFPWTLAKIEAAKALADEFDELTETERERLKETIDDLSSDTPRTELSVHRYRKIVGEIVGRIGKGAASSLKSMVIEVATEAAKKSLFG